MDSSIANASPEQLLLYLILLIIGIFLAAGFLVFSFLRRRRKKQMKLGFEPKREDTAMSEDSQPSPIEQQPVDDEAAAADVMGLNLDILGRGIGSETSEAESPAPQVGEGPIDIAARLGGAPPPSSAPEPPVLEGSVAAPVQPVPLPPAPPPSSEAPELLRLLRDPESGQLVVEVAGKHFRKLADIDDKEVGQYVLELAAHLLAFTNGVVATKAGVKSVYVPQVDETPLPIETPPPSEQEMASAEPEVVPKPSPEAEAAFLASLQSQPPPEPLERRGLFGKPKPKSTIGPGQLLSDFNLAAEINKIVQVRLLVSPLAATTHLDILSDPAGGIQIKVNDTIYPSPDDIPDPDVKALIKDSIKQWERS